MAGRTLLDIFTGGRVKHTGVGKYRGSPGAAPTVPAVFSKLYESMTEYQERGMSEEVFPAGKNIFGQPTEPITQGNLYEIAMGVAGVGAVVKTANTAGKLFKGWLDNLDTYMATLSKKQLRRMNRQDNIVREAMNAIQKYGDDIKGTQGALHSINKSYGLGGKVVVPEIKGVAVRGAKQAEKATGDIKKPEYVSGTKWRKKKEAKDRIARKKLKESGDEPSIL